MAKTRASGEGTIYKNEKYDRWEGQFSYDDPKTGKKGARKKFTGATQKEVAAKGKAFLDGLKDGLLPNAGKITVWEWLDRWLTDYVKPKVRLKTYEKYETCLRLYIKPTLGAVVMMKLKAPDVQRVFNEMRSSGGQNGEGLSTSTVRGTRRYFIMALEKAVRLGYLGRNVVKDTDPPQLVKEPIHPLTKEQAESLLAAAKDGEYIYYGLKQRRKPTPDSNYQKELAYAAVLLALNTGMRLGEVLGLKWIDIDFKANVVNVQRSLVSTRAKGMIFEEPKTKGSKRKIPIPAKVTKALECYEEEQQRYSDLLGDKFKNTEGLVFANLWGHPLNNSNFTGRYFKKLAAYVGLDKSFSFHDLRHTHATMLLSKGVNIKVISERLGHCKIQMTLDTYSHLMPDMQETAVLALESLNIL